MPNHEHFSYFSRIQALCEAFLKESQPSQKSSFEGSKNSNFYCWFRTVKKYKLNYSLTLAAGLFSVIPSAALVLLVTYAISILQGSPRPLTWGELVGEHASRWLGPIVRHTPYEDGLSVDMQRWFIVPALIGVALLGNLLKATLEYNIEKLGEWVARDLRMEISDRYLEASYLDARKTSGSMLASFLGDDTREIRQCFTRLCGSIPIEVISASVYLALLALLDTQLFVLFFAIFLPAGIIVRATGKYLRSLARIGVHIQTELTQSFLEKMKGWQTIQTFSAQPIELERFQTKNKSIYDVWRRSARAKSLSSPSVEWLGIAAGACVLILALRRVSEGALPSSILTAFLVTVAQLSNSLQTVVNQLNTTKKGTAALRRIQEFLEQKRNDNQSETTSVPNKFKIKNTLQLSKFSLKSVTLNHPSIPQLNLCENMNLELCLGDTLAIAGPSGAGKSTLLECMAGLKKPDYGSTQLELSANPPISNPVLSNFVDVAYLSQEPFIFDGQLAENVAYPDKFDPSSRTQIERIQNALQKARLHNKNLTDNALTLSGGEKQRLAFARAFYANPTVWFIDEGTSALDAKTEAELMENLKSTARQSIVVFVAHRAALRTLANKHIFVGT